MAQKVIVIIVVIFIIYAIVTQPAHAASVTGNIWDEIKHVLNSIGTFFDNLVSS